MFLIAAHSVSVGQVCATLNAQHVRRVAVNPSELQSAPASGNPTKIATNGNIVQFHANGSYAGHRNNMNDLNANHIIE